MNPIKRVILALVIFFAIAWSPMYIPAIGRPLSQHAMEVLIFPLYIAPLFGLIFFGINIAICNRTWRLEHKKEVIIVFVSFLFWLIINIMIVGENLNWFR